MQFSASHAAFLEPFGRFLRSWVSSPTSVGAIAPSGRELARLMSAGLHCGSRVLELGAGTGNLTRGILNAHVEPSKIDLIEIDPAFVRLLRRRFPGVSVHSVDAISAANHLPHLRSQVDCVVSGLPLLLFTRAQRYRLLRSAFQLLGEDGVFHQFTYVAKCPIERGVLSRLGLESRRSGIAARNFPPAFVYRISRRP